MDTEETPIEPVVDAVVTQPQEPFDILAMLMSEVSALKARVEALEKVAHSEHSITPDGVTQIAGAAVAQINEQLKARMVGSPE